MLKMLVLTKFENCYHNIYYQKRLMSGRTKQLCYLFVTCMKTALRTDATALLKLSENKVRRNICRAPRKRVVRQQMTPHDQLRDLQRSFRL